MSRASLSQTKSGAGPSDAALVVAARSNEAWAIEALYRRYVRVAVGLAHRLLPIDEEVDDLVQDCFINAFQQLGRLENPQAFGAWLGSIVVRTASKRLRRRRLLLRLGLKRNEVPNLDTLIANTAPPDLATEVRKLYAVIEAFPAEERAAIILRNVEGFEVQQVAEYMSVSLSTAKRRLAAAERRLKKLGGE